MKKLAAYLALFSLLTVGIVQTPTVSYAAEQEQTTQAEDGTYTDTIAVEALDQEQETESSSVDSSLIFLLGIVVLTAAVFSLSATKKK